MTSIEAFFLPPDIQDVPKIIKNIEGIFSPRHNLGLMSGAMDTLNEARIYYRNVSCDTPLYTQKVNGNIYISRKLMYHPVVRSFVSKQNTFHQVIYRWNQVSPTGILLQSIVLNG